MLLSVFTFFFFLTVATLASSGALSARINSNMFKNEVYLRDFTHISVYRSVFEEL